MSPIKTPANLPELVRSAFNRARADGDLTYFATQATVLTANSIPFQLRFSPALANKPTAASGPKTGDLHKPFDPFENPENGPLFIADISSSGHNLVLNKFAVVPEHFILATKDFKQQTHLLEPQDLAATYACIEAYRQYGEDRGGENAELYAFFNSGTHSGASQPHRHIQLLPVARMKEGLEENCEWDVLAKRLVQQQHEAKLPFATFGREINHGMNSEELHSAYVSLFRKAVDAVEAHVGPVNDIGNGEAPISYNLAMTSNSLVLMPRLAEGAPILDNGALVGKLSLNGTVLAGTALVKNEAEWNALNSKGGSAQMLEVLTQIGVPKIAEHSKKL